MRITREVMSTTRSTIEEMHAAYCRLTGFRLALDMAREQMWYEWTSRGLGVAEVVLQQWQDRALKGMLDALEPKGTGTGRGPMLPARLEKQLSRQTAERAGRMTRLSRRLAKIQAGKEEAKTA